MVKSVLRMVLVGRTGAGKSSSGNRILGTTSFGSEKDSEFVTKFCQEESSTIDGRNLSVLDTPDVFNRSGPKIDIEIKRLKNYIADGPCAILQVIGLDSRIEESLTDMEKYEELFGEECFGNGLILFTSSDGCCSSIENWKNKYPNLLTAMEKYGNRYHIISNFTKSEDKDQVKELLLKIESTLTRAVNSNTDMGEAKMKNGSEKDGHLRERRILLLGKTGVGKSATGNTILGSEVFKSAADFSSVTRQCQKGSAAVGEWNITVVDTPDFFYTTHPTQTQDVSSEIGKSLSLCAPGAHALLLLFPVGTFTEQENDVFKVFESAFGKAAAQYTIVVFTHGDELCGTTIEKLSEKNENVRDLLHQCGGRHHVLDNEERNHLSQVTELLEKVDQMVSDNGGSLYTIDMFHEAEAMFKEEWERMLMEIAEEKRSETQQQDVTRFVRDPEERVEQEEEERNGKEKERLRKEETTERETEGENRRKARKGEPRKRWGRRMMVWIILGGVIGGMVGFVAGIVARRYRWSDEGIWGSLVSNLLDWDQKAGG